MLGPTPDIKLVRKALQGKQRAWEQLIERYESRIYNYALRMTGNREDAMDLMQEIFMSVYRNLDRFSQEAPFAAWLFRIAAHRATDFYRRRRPTEELDGNTVGHGGGDPFGETAHREMNQVILNLLQQLPLEQRQVVEMKYFQEMTFEEIADCTGVPTNTLKSRLYGALKKMKNMPEVAHAL